MQDEQDKGLTFMQSLSQNQQADAILMKDKSGNHNLSEAYKDNIKLDYAGLRCNRLSKEQKQAFMRVAAKRAAADSAHQVVEGMRVQLPERRRRPSELVSLG